jgi:uncharacterized protein Yka (UPF0111/DUF47 family)
MTRHRWFLPERPDVVGMLCEQAAITVEGLQELVEWAGGDAAAGDRLRVCEHRADAQKREVRRALTTAFLTPLEPEDIFELSRGLDEVLNGAKNTVREAEVMGSAPDAAMRAMAEHLVQGAHQLAAALSNLRSDRASAATAAADAAVRTQRSLEHVYRAAMSALIEVDDLPVVTARRELYRRLARTGDVVVAVAERVWYAVLKQT